MGSKKRRRQSWFSVKSVSPISPTETLGSDVVTPVDMTPIVDPGPLQDDDSHLYNQAQINSSLRRLLTYLLASLTLSWCVGAIGLSFAWLLLIVALAIARWNSQVALLLNEARWEEVRRVRRRKALGGCETAEWFNDLLNRWWLCSADSLFRLARERFEPLLNESKPHFVEKVELRQFTLGEQTPCIQSVRSYDGDAGNKIRLFDNLKASRLEKNHVTLEVGVHLNSEEFRLILGARLFSKGIGVDVEIVMEKIYLCGKLAVTLTLDMMAPFPHISHVRATFLEKPEVWFSCRVLKTLQMMDVPILKTWLHSVVSDALETALVDPGHLTWIPTSIKKDAPTPEAENKSSLAHGVLIVSLTIPSIDGHNDGDQKWMVLRMGDQTWRTSPFSAGWTENPCFLVESLQTDKLHVKIKSKRLVSSITLAQYEMCLSEYNLENSQFVETHLQKNAPRIKEIPSVSLRLEYVPVAPINLDQTPPMVSNSSATCGILTVFIHGAQGLSSNDVTRCNPYCILFNNRKKVKSTPYAINSLSPQWEKSCQLLVHDISDVSLSFVVCSWNTKKMTDDEMLGVAVLNMTKEDIWVVNKPLQLSGSDSATLSVSVTFQPIFRMCNQIVETNSVESLEETIRPKRNSSSWMHQAKSFLGRGDQDTQSGAEITNILASGHGLMEIAILRARDLMAMDMNGFSDPYCELKVSNECKYKTSVKKKTLNPQWDENAIMGMPRQGEVLEVTLWDHDTFGMKDFLGNVTFLPDEIRQAAKRDAPLWYSLQGVRCGEIELRIRIISDDLSYQTLNNKQVTRLSAEPSPIPRRGSMERSRVRLGVHVPPPTPPRTVSIPNKQNDALHRGSPHDSTNGDIFIEQSDTCVPRVTISESPSITRASSRASSHLTVESLPPSPTVEPVPKKKENDMSGFRSMRLKVSRSLRLRRFKSEINVRSPNGPSSQMNGLSPVGLTRDIMSHAVSQPSINKPTPVRPTELNLNCCPRPDTYTGVEGKVIQAQGLHVAHVAQLYCRIKLVGAVSGRDKHGVGKTLAKSHLLPAMPNPQFQLDFQITSPESVPRQAVLLFEIRSSGKEVLALRRVTLQDLLSGDLKETHTWLALNNGATLEVTIAHSRILKKQSKKLFRSWSVHRIGKV